MEEAQEQAPAPPPAVEGSPPPPYQQQRPRRWGRLLAALGAAAVIVALVVVGLDGGMGGRPPPQAVVRCMIESAVGVQGVCVWVFCSLTKTHPRNVQAPEGSAAVQGAAAGGVAVRPLGFDGGDGVRGCV